MLGLEDVDLVGEALSSSPQNRAASLASTWLLIGSSLSLQMFVCFTCCVNISCRMLLGRRVTEGWLGLPDVPCPLGRARFHHQDRSISCGLRLLLSGSQEKQGGVGYLRRAVGGTQVGSGRSVEGRGG